MLTIQNILMTEIRVKESEKWRIHTMNVYIYEENDYNTDDQHICRIYQKANTN